MEVNNMATEACEVFNLTRQRALELLDACIEVCGNVYIVFPTDYCIDNADGSFQLNIGAVINKMLSHANTLDEKHFILYGARAGVDSLHAEFAKIYEQAQGECL